MAAFAPYERRPKLAVGLSGGADSTALTLLAENWARRRRGAVVALVVDHRLRPESSAEARAVAARCARRGIPVEILVREGPALRAGIEAAAREARHALLGEAARRHGALHLLLAHHRGDQAETVAMRRAMASGPVGLAGMAACVEHASHRVLRPLLDIGRERLVATLVHRGESWVEDPMNRDARFARARMRLCGAPDAPGGDMARHRMALEAELAACLPALAFVDERGCAQLRRDGLARLPPALARLALARIAQCVGGRAYPPRTDGLERLAARLRARGPAAASLGRCQWTGGEIVAVERERRNLPMIEARGGGCETLWDGRFRLALPAGAWTLRAWRPSDAALTGRGGGPVPYRVAQTLPVVVGPEGLAAAPHFGWAREGGAFRFGARFAPPQPLAGPSFTRPRGSGMLAPATPYEGGQQ